MKLDTAPSGLLCPAPQVSDGAAEKEGLEARTLGLPGTYGELETMTVMPRPLAGL
jgi:hypothetical protein